LYSAGNPAKRIVKPIVASGIRTTLADGVNSKMKIYFWGVEVVVRHVEMAVAGAETVTAGPKAVTAGAEAVD